MDCKTIGSNDALRVVSTKRDAFSFTMVLVIGVEGWEAYCAWLDAIKVSYLPHLHDTPTHISLKPAKAGTKAYINGRFAGLFNRRKCRASVVVWHHMNNGRS